MKTITENRATKARTILARYPAAPNSATAALYLAAALSITYPEAATLVAEITGA